MERKGASFKPMIENLCKDPFRLCFPVAIALAIYGCTLWIGFALMASGVYPGQSHTYFFVGGFIYLSIVGFLMTAIPRFTQTNYLSIRELTLLFALVLGVCLSLILSNYQIFWFTASAGWLLVVAFSVSRFRARAQNPPVTFLFVGLGILLGGTGSFLMFLSYSGLSPSPNIDQIGKIFFFDAMILSFVIGIGGRLIPGILGFQEIVSPLQNQERPQSFLKSIPKMVWLLAAVFLASLVIEASGSIQMAHILRMVVVTFVALFYWKIFQMPPERKWHGYFVIAACWSILLSSWMLAMTDQHRIAFKHIGFIGGYTLLTLLVASRVILAHGSNSLNMERRIFPFAVLGILIVLAAATRVFADFTPTGYTRHLGFAALSLLIGFIVWTGTFIPKLFKVIF